MSNPSVFIIHIPTKPYIKKYLHTLYGNPVQFTTDNFFGITIAAHLERPVEFKKNKEILQDRFDKLDAHLPVALPMAWLKKYQFGYALSNENILSVNKLFEKRFEEELFMFCELMNICGCEIKHTLEAFCEHYTIEIEEDISFETLKKKEYRFRKSIRNKPRRCPPKTGNLLSKLSREKVLRGLQSINPKSYQSSLSFPKK